MTKEIKQYIAETEKLLAGDDIQVDWRRVNDKMLIRIGFYQHERLIHLLVTIAFAVMTLISFYLSLSSMEFWPLFGLFFIMDIPYVIHYYFLENSVQKLYKLYYIVQLKVNETHR